MVVVMLLRFAVTMTALLLLLLLLRLNDGALLPRWRQLLCDVACCCDDAGSIALCDGACCGDVAVVVPLTGQTVDSH